MRGKGERRSEGWRSVGWWRGLGLSRGSGGQLYLNFNYEAGADSPGIMAWAKRSKGFSRHFSPHQILFDISQFHFSI